MSRRPTDRHVHYPLRPIDWHPQDWILVVEALCWFASDELVEDADTKYAHWLVDGIAAQHGLEASELLRQADRSSVSGDSD